MPSKKSYKHLSFDERLDIEAGLKAKRSISDIAGALGRSDASVAREIRRNRIDEGRGNQPHVTSNDCAVQYDCQVKGLCGDCNTRRCAACKKRNCRVRCNSYSKHICSKIISAPYCCNSCTKYRRCGTKRFSYSAKIAQAKAEKRLTASREGINMEQSAFEEMVAGIWPLVAEKGQSPAQVWATHKSELGISERTFYRYVALGQTGMSKIHMPKAAAYKPRKSHKRRSAKELAGHTYADFLALESETQESAVEMDCVEGIKSDSQVLLTLLFRTYRLLLVFVLAEHTAACVLSVFDYLEGLLGADEFTRLFGVILTDRGHEFIRFEDLQCSCFDAEQKRCHLYYADPMRADQKGAIENAHLYIRRILPKKTSFENLDAYKAAVLMSHINSVPRRSLGGLCALDFADKIFPRDFLEELGIEKVDPDEVILKPTLLK